MNNGAKADMTEDEMSRFIFSDCELAFANSAYLSELWAVRDLQRMKMRFAESWSEARDQQLQDEVRHARKMLDFLKAANSPVVSDLNYSMQSRLYGPRIDLSISKNLGEATAVHDLTEHRAAWIYRTYCKHGSNTSLISLCREILRDEQDHFPISADGASPEMKNTLTALDRQLFRKELPAKYGRVMIFSKSFWSDYFSGAKVSTKTDAHELTAG